MKKKYKNISAFRRLEFLLKSEIYMKHKFSRGH